jgi:hypothetical protein
MLVRDPDERPTAAAIHVEATRLAEVYAHGAVEEIEVELVDILHTAAAVQDLGWMPPGIPSYQGRARGTLRRRRET